MRLLRASCIATTLQLYGGGGVIVLDDSNGVLLQRFLFHLKQTNKLKDNRIFLLETILNILIQ